MWLHFAKLHISWKLQNQFPFSQLCWRLYQISWVESWSGKNGQNLILLSERGSKFCFHNSFSANRIFHFHCGVYHRMANWAVKLRRPLNSEALFMQKWRRFPSANKKRLLMLLQKSIERLRRTLGSQVHILWILPESRRLQNNASFSALQSILWIF